MEQLRLSHLNVKQKLLKAKTLFLTAAFISLFRAVLFTLPMAAVIQSVRCSDINGKTYKLWVINFDAKEKAETVLNLCPRFGQSCPKYMKITKITKHFPLMLYTLCVLLSCNSVLYFGFSLHFYQQREKNVLKQSQNPVDL